MARIDDSGKDDELDRVHVDGLGCDAIDLPAFPTLEQHDCRRPADAGHSDWEE
jgi:hypothetical protein